jgi:large conductance mechanosensitive channel
MLKNFKDFVFRGNLIEVAVAFVIGAAFATLVKALVTDLFTPLLSIPGHADFSSLTFTVNGSIFRYGDFINSVIAFVAIAVALYFFIVAPVEAVLRRREKAEPTKDCPECLSEIPLAARRCAYCTSELSAA